MSATQEQSVVDIHFIKVLEGIGKASGKPYRIPMAQCIVTYAGGEKLAGELMLSKELETVKPGSYHASFDLGQYQGRITARVCGLSPVRPAASAPVPPPQKAA